MILIVDDDLKALNSLERVLRYAGLESVAVSNGTEALSLLHVRRPALVILDVNMPCLNGLDLLRALRLDPACGTVPVMMYTSEFEPKCEAQAREAGAQDYLVKGTVGLDTLIERVRRLAENPRGLRLTR
jgi:CheY-like chemotaxis protein